MISNLLGRKARIVPDNTPCEVVALVPMPQGYASFTVGVRVDSGDDAGVIRFVMPDQIRVDGPTASPVPSLAAAPADDTIGPTDGESDDTDELTKRLSQPARGIDPNGVAPLTPRLRRTRPATETE